MRSPISGRSWSPHSKSSAGSPTCHSSQSITPQSSPEGDEHVLGPQVGVDGAGRERPASGIEMGLDEADDASLLGGGEARRDVSVEPADLGGGALARRVRARGLVAA
jgi:hypothetical protein